MATNRYFNNYTQVSEQNLVESLIVEATQIYGVDCFYLPREYQAEDKIFGEDVLSHFTKYYEMEMYIEDIETFGGQGDLLNKFGLQINDTFKLSVPMTVFESASNGEMSKPREGDLIYCPVVKHIFEIRFVEDEPVFFALGKTMQFLLKCELFIANEEKIEIGEPDVDDIAKRVNFSLDLVLGAGSGTYQENEIVYQGSNLGSATASGLVTSWDATGKVLKVREIFGVFTPATAVKGNDSAASYTLSDVDLLTSVNDPIADNTNIKDKSADAVDKSEPSPFGEW